MSWLLERREELPHLLVVVPTAQSGRRLREALAESAGAILAPKVVGNGVSGKWGQGANLDRMQEQVSKNQMLRALESWGNGVLAT